MVRWSSRNNNNNSGAELTTTLTFIMGCRIRPSSYNNNTSTRNQDKCSGCPRLCCFMNISFVSWRDSESMEYVRRLTCSNFLVGGSVVRGYEPVRRIFEDFFLSRQESRAQLCVYVDQQKVVGKMIPVYHYMMVTMHI